MQCRIEGCGRVVYRVQLCRRHHYRLQVHGDPVGGGPLRETEHQASCAMPGCQKPYLAKGLCAQHYAMRRMHGDPLYREAFAKDQPCAVRGCGALQVAKGYCGKHYQRYYKHGDPLTSLRAEIGSGGLSTKGYRIVYHPEHPNANKHGRLPEHRYVMAQMLGRPLLPTENVHHRNGNRLDNRPENLELWVRTQPCGQRVEELVRWARGIIAQYGGLVDDASLQDAAADCGGD